MPNPNVTIRHARSAIHLILSGALHDIGAAFADDQEDEERQAIVQLFDEVVDEIDRWETPETNLTRTDAMITEMQATMGSVEAFRDILAKFDLLP